MTAKQVWNVIQTTVSEWNEDNASRLAASLAYYTLLAIAPLLVLALAIVGLGFGEEAARGRIAGELTAVVGAQAGKALQDIVANARTPSTGIISSVLSLAVLVAGASGVFGELQQSLNTVWGVEPKPGRGLRGFLRDRFLSFTMVMGVAFLLLVSLIATTLLAAVGRFMADTLPGGAGLWHVINTLVSLGVTAVLFAVMFKGVPDVKVAWRSVFVGAFVTALLFTLGKFLLGLYLGRASVGSGYGAAGLLIVLVVWVYYSAQILFLGAEFTQVLARTTGSPVEPTANAMPTSAATPEHGLPKAVSKAVGSRGGFGEAKT